MRKIFVVYTVLLVSTIFAQLPNGDRALLHTQIARTIEPGLIKIYTNTNFYTKAGNYIGSLKPADFSSVNYWLVAGNLAVSAGLMEHFDLNVALRLYQDVHSPDKEYNFPDDLFITLKTGTWDFARKHYYAGFLLSSRIPLGKVNNYPWAEYASGAFEYGFLWTFSYYSDPYLPNRSLNMHFNIGWWNHNEKGKVLYTDPGTGVETKASRNSNDFRMAFGVVYPTGLFEYRLEMSGILYLTKPDEVVLSAEEWAFLSPSLRMKPGKLISLDLGFDFRISPGNRQWTNDAYEPHNSLDLSKNYPPWKVHLGLNFSLDVLKGSSVTYTDYKREEAQKKIEFFEKIVEEREKAQDVQEEVDNLRKVRRDTERELDKIRKELED